MNSMKFLELPLVAWGGIFLLILIIIQILLGLGLVRLGAKTHKNLGFVILATAIFHAFLGYQYILGG